MLSSAMMEVTLSLVVMIPMFDFGRPKHLSNWELYESLLLLLLSFPMLFKPVKCISYRATIFNLKSMACKC